MDVFWDAALNSLTDTDQLSKQLTAFIIMVMTEVVCSSGMWRRIYWSTSSHISQDSHFHIQHYENFTYHRYWKINEEAQCQISD
jgi:hypothetical protein